METIIVYTKYYLQAVIEVLDTYDLSVQIICVPSYDLVHKYVKSTPNLRGVIFLEHRTGFSSGRAYKAILKTLDEIAEASRQPMCVSIISNTEAPRKIVGKVPTNNLTIYFTKFTMMHSDTFRFEGLATVIANTIGIADNSILLELDTEGGGVLNSTSSLKVEFIRNCLEVVTVSDKELDAYTAIGQEIPKIGSLLHLRRSGDNDEKILENAEGLMKVFAKHAIERREGDVQ